VTRASIPEAMMAEINATEWIGASVPAMTTLTEVAAARGESLLRRGSEEQGNSARIASHELF
jgi:hypothetical protein